MFLLILTLMLCSLTWYHLGNPHSRYFAQVCLSNRLSTDNTVDGSVMYHDINQSQTESVSPDPICVGSKHSSVEVTLSNADNVIIFEESEFQDVVLDIDSEEFEHHTDAIDLDLIPGLELSLDEAELNASSPSIPGIDVAEIEMQGLLVDEFGTHLEYPEQHPIEIMDEAYYRIH